MYEDVSHIQLTDGQEVRGLPETADDWVCELHPYTDWEVCRSLNVCVGPGIRFKDTTPEMWRSSVQDYMEREKAIREKWYQDRGDAFTIDRVILAFNSSPLVEADVPWRRVEVRDFEAALEGGDAGWNMINRAQGSAEREAHLTVLEVS